MSEQPKLTADYTDPPPSLRDYGGQVSQIFCTTPAFAGAGSGKKTHEELTTPACAGAGSDTKKHEELTTDYTDFTDSSNGEFCR